MHRRRGITRAAMALLLTAATLPVATGCARRAQIFSTGRTGAETTAAAGTTATAESSATTGVTHGGGSSPSGSGSGSSGGSASASSSKLSTKDAAALDAELSAIQGELDRLNLPTDSDFDSIGSGLE